MKGFIKELLTRVKADFQLSMVLILSMFAIVAMTPFSIYRLIQGNMVVFALDFGVVFFSSAIAIYAWTTGKSTRAAFILASGQTLGLVFASILNPILTPYWAYCVVLLNFTLVPSRQAFLLMIPSFLIITIWGSSFTGDATRSTFIVTFIATTVFAYIFAERNDYQRQKLLKLARTDPLTGSANRRAFDEEVVSALKVSGVGAQRSINMAFVDIDHFKKINDDFGHEVGDEVLIRFADLVLANLRPEDSFFRIGGEEFCVLMDNTDKNGAIACSEKLCDLIRNSALLSDRNITVSIGVSQISPEDSVESWLKRCDTALYSAKSQGRDQVIYHGFTY